MKYKNDAEMLMDRLLFKRFGTKYDKELIEAIDDFTYMQRKKTICKEQKITI